LYPVLRREDRNIDTAIYASEAAYLNGQKPIATVELEIKHPWDTYNCKYRYIDFLCKKERLLTKKSTHNAYWACFNHERNNVCIIPLQDCIDKGVHVVKYCKNIKKYDHFYRIPRQYFGWGLGHVESYIMKHTKF
jgi:hypothetical protein